MDKLDDSFTPPQKRNHINQYYSELALEITLKLHYIYKY